jgi:hypothetical protein
MQSSNTAGDWIAGYLSIGYVLGAIAGWISFIGAYVWCIATYGFLFGLGLGWLPSMILGWVVFGATCLLWGPAALCVVALIVGLAFQ